MTMTMKHDEKTGKKHALRLIARLEHKLSMHEKYGISSPIVDLSHEMIMLIETMGKYPFPYGVAVIATLKDSRASGRGLFYKALEHALNHHHRYHGKRHDEIMRKGGKGGCSYCFHIHTN